MRRTHLLASEKAPRQLNLLRGIRFRRFILESMKVAVLLTVFMTFSTQAQQDVGYVLSLRGNWHLQKDNRPLKRFGKLPAGATITVRKPIDDLDYITVALFSGETIQRLCNKGSACGGPIVLPKLAKSSPEKRNQGNAAGTAQAAPRSVLNTISETFWSLVTNPEHYFVPTFVRDTSPGFLDAVASQDSGKVDLSPVFRDVPVARYRLVAEPLSLENPTKIPSDSEEIHFDLKWDKHEPNLARTDQLQTGLYNLVSGSHYHSWVLVTKAGEYQAVADCVKKATEMTKQWVPGEDRLSARMFLRAYLVTLAKRLQEPSNRNAASLVCSEAPTD